MGAVALPERTFAGRYVVFALLAFAVLFTVGFYWTLTSFDFVTWDDDLYVTMNPDIQSWSAANVISWFTKPYAAIYAPLAMMTYALEYQLFGLSPAGYHATNILLHALNVGLVFLVMLRLFSSRPAAFAAALLFAVHPAQLESVAWISERKNLLFAFFALSAFLFYAGRASYSEMSPRRKIGVYALFICSLMSKPTAGALPIVFLIYDFSFRGRQERGTALWYASFFLPMAVVAALTIVLYPGVIPTEFGWSPFLERSWEFMGAMGEYVLRLLPWSSRSLLDYMEPGYTASSVMKGVLFLSGGCVLIGFWRFSQKNRELFFWVSSFFVILLPVVNIIRVPVADRHLYLGVFFALGALISLVQLRRRLLLITFLAAFVLSVPFSLARMPVWINGETLWTSGMDDHPSVWYRSRMQLATHFEDQGDWKRAEAVYINLIIKMPRYSPYPYINAYAIQKTTGRLGRKTNRWTKWRFRTRYTWDYTLEVLFERLVAMKSDPEAVMALMEDVKKGPRVIQESLNRGIGKREYLRVRRMARELAEKREIS